VEEDLRVARAAEMRSRAERLAAAAAAQRARRLGEETRALLDGARRALAH